MKRKPTLSWQPCWHVIIGIFIDLIGFTHFLPMKGVEQEIGT